MKWAAWHRRTIVVNKFEQTGQVANVSAFAPIDLMCLNGNIGLITTIDAVFCFA